MRLTGITLAALLPCTMLGADVLVTGEITYMTSTSVYTTVGRTQGVQESTMLFVIDGADTIASLEVLAVSSSGSVCRVVRSTRELEVGTTVTGVVTLANNETGAEESSLSAFSPAVLQSPGPSGAGTGRAPFEVSGRISGQFYGTFQNRSEYNTSQPGVVTKLKVASTDAPVTFDMYANFRTLSYGSSGMFAPHSRNQSRLYRIAVEYDDGTYRFMLGRFAPSFFASIGYVDGLLVSASAGRIVFGALGGFQPAGSQRGMSTDYKKFGFFTSYYPGSGFGNRVTFAYARTYFLSDLDREAASVNASLVFSSTFSLSAQGDVDLRKWSDGSLTYSPSLSQAFVTARYRLIPALGLGIGVNATRPFYSYSALRTLPPEVIETRVRGGLGFSIYVYFPAGISLTNTYTPRTSEGTFADNFTEYAALTFAHLASTGVTLRTNFNMNATDYTDSHGYGVNLSRSMWRAFDLTVRYQQYMYTVTRTDLSSESSTIGVDLLIPLSQTFSILGTYESYQTSGINMNTVFAEVSVRF